jgi:phospholipid N-methyltransferase
MNKGENKQSATPEKQPGALAQCCIFAKNFLKHPAMVGWLIPSSRFLVKEVLKQVDWTHAKVIVEYGPGLGSFTTRILQRMRPDARLIVFEINPEFVKYLRESIKDPRLEIVQQSAEEVQSVLARLGFKEADCVISGIPFSALPHALRDSIVRKTHAVLRPNGRFLVYQVSTAVVPYLEHVFGTVYRDFSLLNLIPARIFYCARAEPQSQSL